MKKQLVHYYICILGIIGLATLLQFLLPTYIGFFVSFGIVIVLPLIVRLLMGKKLRDAGIFTGFNGLKIKKICLVCGAKACGRQCNKCGSRQFRMT